MNEFGRNILGLKGIFKKKQFWNSKATPAERTFKLEGGPGCDPKEPGRKIAVSWDSDGGRETISSYDLEAIIDEKGNVIPRKDAADVDDTPALFLSNGAKNVEAPTAKPKGRNAWAPMPAEEPAKAAPTFAGLDLASKVDVAVGHRHPAPEQPAPVNGTLVTADELNLKAAPAAIPGTRKTKGYDVTLAVAMYAEGKTIQEIAAAQGFAPGNGLNKTRVALREAGVWKGK